MPARTSRIRDRPATDCEANVVEGDTDEQVLLDRHGDQLLDLGRGQPESFRLDLDGRRCKLGEDVHGHLEVAQRLEVAGRKATIRA